jgi:hypothetical protein
MRALDLYTYISEQFDQKLSRETTAPQKVRKLEFKTKDLYLSDD